MDWIDVKKKQRLRSMECILLPLQALLLKQIMLISVYGIQSDRNLAGKAQKGGVRTSM